MDNTLLIAIGVLHLIAVADIWTSRLTRAAKILWTLNVLFLVGAGFAAWLLTRHTAHQPLADIVPGSDHEPIT